MNPYILKKPVITEKSLSLANVKRTYVFLVVTSATKHQIKEAVESLFSVQVERVRTITDQPEKKRTGKRRVNTTTSKEKKALVTLKEGNSIDLFEVGGEGTE